MHYCTHRTIQFFPPYPLLYTQYTSLTCILHHCLLPCCLAFLFPPKSEAVLKDCRWFSKRLITISVGIAIYLLWTRMTLTTSLSLADQTLRHSDAIYSIDLRLRSSSSGRRRGSSVSLAEVPGIEESALGLPAVGEAEVVEVQTLAQSSQLLGELLLHSRYTIKHNSITESREREKKNNAKKLKKKKATVRGRI